MLSHKLGLRRRSLAEVAIVNACVQEAQAHSTVEWALCRRSRRSRRGATFTNEEQGVGVAGLEASDGALDRAGQQLLQHLGGRLVWVGIQDERSATGDMRASHRSATESSGAGVAPVAGGRDVAAGRPHVSAAAVIAEGGAAVPAVRGTDGDGRWHESGREPARVAVGIASCNHHHDTRVHGCVHCIPHGLLSATASQAHARDGRTSGIRGQPVQSVVAPGPRSASLIRKDLHTLYCRTWSNAIGLSSRSACAVSSVTLPVTCAAQVPVALLRLTNGHVESGRRTTAKVVVRMADTSVEDEDGGLAARAAARIRSDPVQTPSLGLRLCLDLWDHGHSGIRLNELDQAGSAVDDLLEVLLCSTHLQEGHTALAWVALQRATLRNLLADALDLSICRAVIQHHVPFALRLALHELRRLLALIRRLVVQHRHTCDELGVGSIGIPSPMTSDASTLDTSNKQGRAKATREGHHDSNQNTAECERMFAQ